MKHSDTSNDVVTGLHGNIITGIYVSCRTVTGYKGNFLLKEGNILIPRILAVCLTYDSFTDGTMYTLNTELNMSLDAILHFHWYLFNMLYPLFVDNM